MLKNAVWITGAKGAVGSYLEQLLENRGYEVLPTDAEIDVCDLKAVNEFASKNRPVTVINCAALAGRAAADDDPTEAYRVNAVGARNIAIASASVGAKLRAPLDRRRLSLRPAHPGQRVRHPGPRLRLRQVQAGGGEAS